MKTIYRQNSKITRVEFKKDGQGLIGAFMLQDFGQEERVLASKWYRNEKAAVKWANEVLK